MRVSGAKLYSVVLALTGEHGIRELLKFSTTQRFGSRPLPSPNDFVNYWRGRVGLEVGGPTPMFLPSGPIPIYQVAKRVDNVDYSGQTLWSGNALGARGSAIEHGGSRSVIAEATDLGSIRTGEYQFLLASHVLEHIANPMRALLEWRRVVHPTGTIFLAVPNGPWTFDHRRPITSIQHILEDSRSGVDESDRTHLAEILALHDPRADEGWQGERVFRERLASNSATRAAHHHVFDPSSLRLLLAGAGLRVLLLETLFPTHIISVCTAE